MRKKHKVESIWPWPGSCLQKVIMIWRSFCAKLFQSPSMHTWLTSVTVQTWQTRWTDASTVACITMSLPQSWQLCQASQKKACMLIHYLLFIKWTGKIYILKTILQGMPKVFLKMTICVSCKCWNYRKWIKFLP